MYGLPKDLWYKYQDLYRMGQDYLELPHSHGGEPLDFDKCLEDAMEKWKFLVKWTSFNHTKLVSELKMRPSFHVVKSLILADEPLCFEVLFLPLVDGHSCIRCPLYNINGKKCHESGSLKETIVRPIRTKIGTFKPFEMVKFLNKIRKGSQIKSIEVF